MFPKKEKSIDPKRSERNMKPTQGVFMAITVLFGMYSLKPNQEPSTQGPQNFLTRTKRSTKKNCDNTVAIQNNTSERFVIDRKRSSLLLFIDQLVDRPFIAGRRKWHVIHPRQKQCLKAYALWSTESKSLHFVQLQLKLPNTDRVASTLHSWKWTLLRRRIFLQLQVTLYLHLSLFYKRCLLSTLACAIEKHYF